MIEFPEHVIENLIKGGIGVIPTDTLYGLVGRADTPETVERIYAVRERSAHKPCIVLVSSFLDLKQFGVEVSEEVQSFLSTRWPGKLSVVLPVVDSRHEYLARGSGGIAFRVPDSIELVALFEKGGTTRSTKRQSRGRGSFYEYRYSAEGV